MTGDFTKRELIAIIETIEAARTCTSESVLNKVIRRVKGLVSAESCICGLASIESNELKNVLKVVNGGYPDEWLKLYMAEELYKTDPIVDHHLKFSMTQLWSDTYKLYGDRTSRDFIKRASDFGLNQGISSGIHDQERRFTSIFSFASGTERFSVRHKKIVDIMTLHLHRALVRTYILTRLTVRPASLPRNIN